MSRQQNHIWCFDMTRHRSHLFNRYLCTHPTVQAYRHPFLQAALFGPERITQYTKNTTPDGKQAEWAPASGTETYADATGKFVRAVNEARDLVSNNATTDKILRLKYSLLTFS